MRTIGARGGYDEGMTLAPIMLCVLLGAAEPTTRPAEVVFDFDALPVRTQKLFERHAPNYVRVNDAIWSAELLVRYQRLPMTSAKAAEPYQTVDAPLLFEPASAKRARRFADIDKENEDLVGVNVLHGSVAAQQEGRVILSVKSQIMVIDALPEGMAPKRGDRLTVLCRAVGEATIYAGQDEVTVPLLEMLTRGAVRPVTPAELAEYFHTHGVDRFDRWQAKKVWDEKPKAKKVYVPADGTGVSQGGTNVGAGASEPVEVITEPGRYHWQWVRGGVRVPTLTAAVKPKVERPKEAEPAAPAE